ncbi:Ms4533A family Cys-rich leader peptide [Streptomyces sp. NPDC088116]
MSPRHAAVFGHTPIELALIGVTALCVADILCR